MNSWYIVLIVLILVWIYSMCNTSTHVSSPVAPGSLPRPVTSRSTLVSRIKSKFENMKSSFGGDGYSSNKNKKDNITDDTVLIFYAPWCGHCKKSMNDFKEATAQGNGKIMMVNSDEDPDIVKKYNVNGFPTIMKSNGTKYTGGRDASSIMDFANKE